MLNNKKLYYFLIVSNLFAAVVGFYLGIKTHFPDSVGYWNMGKSLGGDTFSSWYFFPNPPPETLRTWGYPFFLYICQQFTDAELVIQLIQLALYAVSIFLILELIKKFNPNLIYRNIFLLLLLPNIRIAFYSGQISADLLCIFFLTLYAYMYYSLKDSATKMILLAVCGFAVFQLKPAFLLFPILFFVYQLIFQRTNIKLYSLATILYLLLLLPFGFWNLHNHGVFKVTPLEGGGGIMHMGYWCYKLPENYTEKHYWQNSCVADYTQPNFTSDEEEAANAERFEAEWSDMETQLKPLADQEAERISLMIVEKYGQFKVHTGSYTNAREKLLVGKTVEHIEEDPIFYLKTRVYTACRLWFTGINKREWNDAESLSAKIKVLYPFLVSFIFMFLGLVLVTLSIILRKLSWSKFHFLFLLTIYFGAVHIPFAPQTRFTAPVNLFILLMLSFAVARLIFNKDSQKQNDVAPQVN